MNKIYTLAFLSIAFVFVSSCAYEPDRGLGERPNTNPKPQVNDALKGKPNFEILNIKYETLVLNCSLISEISSQEDLNESKISIPPQPVRPDSPVTNAGEKTTFDLKAQLAVDPTLKEEQTNAKMEIDESDRKLIVALKIKPVLFFESLNLKLDSSVYIMKHTPILTLAYAYTKSTDRTSTTVEGQFRDNVNEGIPFKNLLTTEVIDGKTKSYFVECGLRGDIKKDNQDIKDQWMRIDCSKPADPGRESLHQQNCRAGMPIPDTI